MFLVVAAVAIATVLGFVMLSTVSLANRSGGNQYKMVAAEYLGESGMNLAMYYLQHPPSGDPLVYWSGTNGPIAIGSGGTVDVSVVPAKDAGNATIPWTYEVTCTATAGSTTPITRQYCARMYVKTEYQTKYAGGFNTDVNFQDGTTVNGDIYSFKTITTTLTGLGVSLNGTGYATGFATQLAQTLFHQVGLDPSTATIQGPTVSDVNLYKTYTYNGIAGKAATLVASSLSGTLPADGSATNPAQVFYYDASVYDPVNRRLTLGDNTVINGTLVVDHGGVYVNGQNVQIKPKPGMPALVVYGDIDIAHPLKSLTATGVVFYGGTLKKSGTTPLLGTNRSTFTVTGALLSGATGTTVPIASGYNIRTTVTYDATAAKAPDITSNPLLRQPTGVSMLRWGAP